jgi:predicted nucleotidyltransferase
MTKKYLEAIDSITDQLVRKYKAQKVILFGSAAKGRLNPDSDLDFLVIKDDKENFHARIAKLYKLINKDVPADFLVYTPSELAQRIKLGDPFIQQILREGRVLYG